MNGPDDETKPSRASLVLLGVVVIVLLAIGIAQSLGLGPWRIVREDREARARQAALPPPAIPEWKPSAGRIDIGTELYLATDKSLVGTVAAVEIRHRFPDGTMREGVQIVFPDGERRWVPRDVVKVLYVVR